MADRAITQTAQIMAQNNLYVLPVNKNTKAPFNKGGSRNATTDPDTITRWFNQEFPQANVAIATGKEHGGLVVIDIDLDDEHGIDGFDTLRKWEREHGQLPETAMVKTGSGGCHYYYRSGKRIHNIQNAKDQQGAQLGIDVRGEGGYVVAPPSIHANGNQYEWEQMPKDYPIAEADEMVYDLIRFIGAKIEGEDQERKEFTLPEVVEVHSRNDSIYKLACSLQAKGMADPAIMEACLSLNKNQMAEPLPESEVRRTVASALNHPKGSTGRKEKQEPFCDDFEMQSIEDVEEKQVEWEVYGVIAKNTVILDAGDGGSGKTYFWCKLASDISSGRCTIFENDIAGDVFIREGKKVLFFSSEDAVSEILKPRLRRHGANMQNIRFIDLKDDRFPLVKFNSKFLEKLIEHQRPALVIFDPLQSFIPDTVQMSSRNAMRNCLNPLVAMCNKYECTVLINVHANKGQGVWGRKRVADSGDIWDIARSVFLFGNVDGNLFYCSQEKNNYSALSKTVLFSIEDGIVTFKGFTDKKDKDFIQAEQWNSKNGMAKGEAKEFILDQLREHDGPVGVSELQEWADVLGFSSSAIRKAKQELKNEGKITISNSGYGKEKKWMIMLNKSPF